MPSRHRNPAAIYRPDPELHERAKAAVADVDSDMNAHILGFLRWLVGDTDELPPRPASADQRTAVRNEAGPTAQ